MSRYKSHHVPAFDQTARSIHSVLAQDKGDCAAAVALEFCAVELCVTGRAIAFAGYRQHSTSATTFLKLATCPDVRATPNPADSKSTLVASKKP